MRKQPAIIVLAAAFVLSGCVVTSVHPYYTSKDEVFEKSLVGQWTNTQESAESWKFAKEADNSYHVTYVSDAKTNIVQAHLFKLSGQMFLDFSGPNQDCDLLPPPIPSHLLMRVDQIVPSVHMAPLNHDWLKALLEKDPKALRHLLLGQKQDDQRLVLTAETAELQQFLNKHLKTDDAWKDSIDLKRAEPSEASK
jgi:hypothetical protein